MLEEYPHQARYYGLDEKQLEVLYHVTRWYNGRRFGIRGEKQSIRTHREPKLRQLINGLTLIEYSDDHEDAREKLVEKDLLKVDYVCRRKVNWVPTETGFQAIRDVFDSGDDLLRPPWVDDSDDNGPIWSDPNESLIHRKGVEVMALKLLNTPGCKRLWYYPTIEEPVVEPDILTGPKDGYKQTQVEVLTETNNRERWRKKWRSLAYEDRRTWWIFDGRTAMCSFFNHLDDRGCLPLHGKRFTEPYDRWSAKAVNRKVWKSRRELNTDLPGMDFAYTVTGVFENGLNQVTKWAE